MLIAPLPPPAQNGVLTLRMGAAGTFVLNKQTPNRQLWLSSPISGPKRFNWHVERRCWEYARDHTRLTELLNRELCDVLIRAGCHERVQLVDPVD